MKRISLAEKLILYFFALGITAIVVISVISYQRATRALKQRTFEQLTSLKEVRKQQITTFLQDRVSEIHLISTLFRDKMDHTNNVYNWTNGSRDAHFLRTMQLLKKQGYQRNILVYEQQQDSLFNICPIPSENISRTRKSNNHLFSLIRYKMRSDSIFYIDHVRFDDEGEFSFLLCAVLPGRPEQPEVLIVEIPVAELNQMMVNTESGSGLGLSGETYIVGQDFKMRSSSRFIQNSVMSTAVHTDAAIRAIRGHEGTIITKDYRQIPVLSSFGSIHFASLKWGVLAEIDLEEALIPVANLRITILLISSFISIIFFFCVFLIARTITSPLVRLRQAAEKVGEGNFDVSLPVDKTDEIGALSDGFRNMISRINQQTHELKKERSQRVRAMIDGQEIERQRLSREIHDGIGQMLVVVRMSIERLCRTGHSRQEEKMEEVKDMIDNSIEEIRRISNDLTPSILEEFGLEHAIQNLCQEANSTTDIRFVFNPMGTFHDLTKQTSFYLFRIVQELVSNIIKHSAAAEATITLERNDGSLSLVVVDNGKGFNFDEINPKCNGISNVSDRVQLLHGTFNIESDQGSGTKISISIPLIK